MGAKSGLSESCQVKTTSWAVSGWPSLQRAPRRSRKVVWTWRGDSLHNVVVAEGPVHFRSRIKREGVFVHTFGKKGTYKLICTVHAPDMKMTVVVKPKKKHR